MSSSMQIFDMSYTCFDINLTRATDVSHCDDRVIAEMTESSASDFDLDIMVGDGTNFVFSMET